MMATPTDPQAPPTALEPLPFPVFFVHPDRSRWGDAFEGRPPEPDAEPWRFRDCNDCWVMLSYLRLLRRGLDIHLVARPEPGAINVMGTTDLKVRRLSYGSYMVLCRHDSARPVLGEQAVVQNPLNVLSATEHLVQHWPQPGLLPRLASRDARVEHVTFKGFEMNLWEPFHEPGFRRSLDRLGVTFHVAGKPSDNRFLRWHDYRDDDVVLAVRDLTEADLGIKPASKLINAWHAGTPALLGPEPAFRALRRSELDYIEVRGPDEVIRAVGQLKRDPGLYRAMVENGRARGREFTTDAIAARWREVLAGPVARGFDRWRRAPTIRRLYRPALFAVRTIAHAIEVRRYRRSRDHGFRPTSGQYT